MGCHKNPKLSMLMGSLGFFLMKIATVKAKATHTRTPFMSTLNLAT